MNPVMDKMTKFKEFKISPTNLTNGLINYYEVAFESDVEVKNGDRVLINFPKEIAVLHSVNCAPGADGVDLCTCVKVGES